MNTPLNSDQMDALAGETYLRQFVLSRPGFNGARQMLGAPGWGAEFTIVNSDNTEEVYATASIANNKMAWVQPGVIWLSFQQAETQLWKFRRASWYLDLIAPTTAVDPRGYRDTVLRGFMRCESRGPRSFSN